MLRGMWDLPGPGLERVSPALAGGFLTTEPPGKSPMTILIPQGLFLSSHPKMKLLRTKKEILLPNSKQLVVDLEAVIALLCYIILKLSLK